ncbi:MAG: DNA polymerase III subunit chi [Thioalkalispiraceae bacterium]|jgi:DNA polymerase-3 subunit chi
MTRINFYISPNQTAEANLQLACRIAEKAYNKQNKVYIHTNNAEQARRLDDLLWVFRQGSFVPHCQTNDENQQAAAVVIGFDGLPEIQPDVLINLADQVPNFFTRFERVAEIVSGDEATRKVARERFKFYRERGYPLETHELNS